jgi:hypothetical protein
MGRKIGIKGMPAFKYIDILMGCDTVRTGRYVKRIQETFAANITGGYGDNCP